MPNLYQVTYQIHMPNPQANIVGGAADSYRRDSVAVIVVANAGDSATLQTVVLNNIPALVAGEAIDFLSIEQLVYDDRPIYT